MPNTINAKSTGYDTFQKAEQARKAWLSQYGTVYFGKASQPFRDPATSKWHFNFSRADSTGD